MRIALLLLNHRPKKRGEPPERAAGSVTGSPDKYNFCTFRASWDSRSLGRFPRLLLLFDHHVDHDTRHDHDDRHYRDDRDPRYAEGLGTCVGSGGVGRRRGRYLRCGGSRTLCPGYLNSGWSGGHLDGGRRLAGREGGGGRGCCGRG